MVVDAEGVKEYSFAGDSDGGNGEAMHGGRELILSSGRRYAIWSMMRRYERFRVFDKMCQATAKKEEDTTWELRHERRREERENRTADDTPRHLYTLLGYGWQRESRIETEGDGCGPFVIVERDKQEMCASSQSVGKRPDPAECGSAPST